MSNCPRPDKVCYEFMCGFCDKGKCAYYNKKGSRENEERKTIPKKVV